MVVFKILESVLSLISSICNVLCHEVPGSSLLIESTNSMIRLPQVHAEVPVMGVVFLAGVFTVCVI